MFGNVFFNNEEIRKYTLLFGNLFKNIRLERTNPTDSQVQYEVVQIAYGGREKYIARNTQDPDIERQIAIQLPRMAFELLTIEYDIKRQLNPLNKFVNFTSNGNTMRFVPTPYNFMYNLYITARNVEDASKIIQQILPYFTPFFTVSADIIPDACAYDIQFVLDNVDMKDNYEGNFQERRILVWTLSFTVKGYLFGPQHTQNNVIRWVSANIEGDTAANTIPAVNSNTYIHLANTNINSILPTDPYTIIIDLTENFDIP